MNFNEGRVDCLVYNLIVVDIEQDQDINEFKAFITVLRQVLENYKRLTGISKKPFLCAIKGEKVTTDIQFIKGIDFVLNSPIITEDITEMLEKSGTR